MGYKDLKMNHPVSEEIHVSGFCAGSGVAPGGCSGSSGHSAAPGRCGAVDRCGGRWAHSNMNMTEAVQREGEDKSVVKKRMKQSE